MSRLIDRDVAIKEIERCAATTQDARETRQCCVAAIACFVPTVDAIPVDWIKLNIAISALVEDDEAASLLLMLVDAWHKSGWRLFDGVLPAEEAKKYGIKPKEDA